MRLLPRMNVMLDFILWNQSTWQVRVESDKIQNEKFLLTVGLEPTTLRFLAWCSAQALMKAVLLK